MNGVGSGSWLALGYLLCRSLTPKGQLLHSLLPYLSADSLDESGDNSLQ